MSWEKPKIPCGACAHRNRECGPDCMFHLCDPRLDGTQFAVLDRVFGAGIVDKVLAEFKDPQARGNAISSLVTKATEHEDDAAFNRAAAVTFLRNLLREAMGEAAVASVQLEVHAAATAAAAVVPCAVCTHLRRECAPDCACAPYFPRSDGTRFAVVDRVFGASNVANLLAELAPEWHADAVESLIAKAVAYLQKDPAFVEKGKDAEAGSSAPRDRGHGQEQPYQKTVGAHVSAAQTTAREHAAAASQHSQGAAMLPDRMGQGIADGRVHEHALMVQQATAAPMIQPVDAAMVPPVAEQNGEASGPAGEQDDDVMRLQACEAKRRSNATENVPTSSADYISGLPDEMLCLILRRIGTLAAARTCVLSRRWCKVWTLLLDLELGFAPSPDRIRDALEAHGENIRLLHVSTMNASAESVASWLPVAAQFVFGSLYFNNVAPWLEAESEEDEEEGGEDAIVLPWFERATRVELQFGYLGLIVPPDGICAHLTDLYLYQVKFCIPCDLGDAVSSSRCPQLKKFRLYHCRGIHSLEINSESLQEVDLLILYGTQCLKIVAPALLQLKLEGLNSTSKVNIEAPTLLHIWLKDCFSSDELVDFNITAPSLERLECDRVLYAPKA